jgi:hypothetical protein
MGRPIKIQCYVLYELPKCREMSRNVVKCINLYSFAEYNRVYQCFSFFCPYDLSEHDSMLVQAK